MALGVGPAGGETGTRSAIPRLAWQQSGARAELWAAAETNGKGDYPAIVDAAQETAARYRAFHWPLEFAEVFVDRGGFDAVVGNPPWDEVTVEELAFHARYQPGLKELDDDRPLEQLRPQGANRSAELPENAKSSPAASQSPKNSPNVAWAPAALRSRVENGSSSWPGAPVVQAIGSSTPSMTNARTRLGKRLA
jgi:hypothetical protein